MPAGFEPIFDIDDNEEPEPKHSAADIPRGKYIGKLVGDPPKDEAEHFSRVTPTRRRPVHQAASGPSMTRRDGFPKVPAAIAITGSMIAGIATSVTLAAA